MGQSNSKSSSYYKVTPPNPIPWYSSAHEAHHNGRLTEASINAREPPYSDSLDNCRRGFQDGYTGEWLIPDRNGRLHRFFLSCDGTRIEYDDTYFEEERRLIGGDDPEFEQQVLARRRDWARMGSEARMNWMQGQMQGIEGVRHMRGLPGIDEEPDGDMGGPSHLDWFDQGRITADPNVGGGASRHSASRRSNTARSRHEADFENDNNDNDNDNLDTLRPGGGSVRSRGSRRRSFGGDSGRQAGSSTASRSESHGGSGPRTGPETVNVTRFGREDDPKANWKHAQYMDKRRREHGSGSGSGSGSSSRKKKK